jgi:myo-inositol 2-dehydrogenase/D-chiro-inositol 1-dehydrogenase
MNNETTPEVTAISRRKFLRDTAFTAAGIGAFGILSSKAQSPQNSKTLKVAVVGCGRRGLGVLGPRLGALGNFQDAARILGHNVEVVALCDAFEDNAKQSAEKFRVDPSRCHWGFDSYKKAAASDAEFVIMATPPNFRPVHFDAMVKAGKHCFVEKPVAVDPVGARAVLASGELAKQKGLAAIVGTQRRYDAGYLRNKAKIDAGAIGPILGGTVTWNSRVPWVKERQANWSDAEYLVRNWLNFTELSGDHIVEQHIHNLDVANWFIGRTPQAFLGYGARTRRVTGNQFDFFSCDIDYGDGVHIHSMCRQISGTYMKLGEFFRGAEGQCNGDGKLSGKEVAFQEPKLESPESQVQEHVELIKGVLAGKPLNTIQEGADSTLTAIGARISAYTGQMVRWTDMTENTKSPFYALQLSPTALDFERDSVVMPSEAPALPGQPWPTKA